MSEPWQFPTTSHSNGIRLLATVLPRFRAGGGCLMEASHVTHELSRHAHQEAPNAAQWEAGELLEHPLDRHGRQAVLGIPWSDGQGHEGGRQEAEG